MSKGRPQRKRLPTGPLPAQQLEIFEVTPPSLWQRLKYPLRWLLIGSVIYAAIFLGREYGLTQYIDQKALREVLEPLGPWAPAGFIGVFILAMLLMVIPYALFAGLSGILFGPAWGTLWTVLGGTLAALAVLGFSKLVGRKLIARRAGDPRWENLNQRLRQDGFYYLLLVRALSIVPFNLLNFASAFTAIRLRDFLLANLVGLIPSAFVYAFGTTLLLDPNTDKVTIGVLAGVLLVLLVTPLVFRQARKSRRRQQREQMRNSF